VIEWRSGGYSCFEHKLFCTPRKGRKRKSICFGGRAA
jgi:hypothetical protein